jgi:hypothetical protein
MSIKDGKKPLSEKPAPSPYHTNAYEMENMLSIPADLQKELEEQDLVGRWLNAGKLKEMQGYHKRGWQVYHRPADKVGGIIGFKFGNDPDGIVRRGDCILGVMPTAQHKSLKSKLDKEAKRGYGVNKAKADEMRNLLGSSGIKNARVLEGYDEND